jgi:hypothetical protein
MGLFANYVQIKTNESVGTILQILDQKEKEGEMPYSTTWTGFDAIQKRLGLNMQQIMDMKQSGVLIRVPNGWGIDKDKLLKYPQLGTAPPVPHRV